MRLVLPAYFMQVSFSNHYSSLRWRLHILPKCRLCLNGLHGVVLDSWGLRIWNIWDCTVVHFGRDCTRLSVLYGQSSVSGLCCGWTANAGWRRPSAARIIDPSVATTGGDSGNTSWLRSCKSLGTSPANKYSPSQCSSQSANLCSIPLPQDSTRYRGFPPRPSALVTVHNI
jgi:hypothetical protein